MKKAKKLQPSLTKFLGPKQTCPTCKLSFTCLPEIHAQFCEGKPGSKVPCRQCGEKISVLASECLFCGEIQD